MIASEKAKDLFDKFIGLSDIDVLIIKQICLVHCDEMIDEYWHQMLHRGIINKYACDNMIHYWKEVKNEVNKL